MVWGDSPVKGGNNESSIRFITVGILLAVFTAFSGSFMQWALGYGYTKDNPAGREKVAVHDEVAAAYQVEVTDAVVTAGGDTGGVAECAIRGGSAAGAGRRDASAAGLHGRQRPVVETQPRQLAASYTDESRKPVDASSGRVFFPDERQ